MKRAVIVRNIRSTMLSRWTVIALSAVLTLSASQFDVLFAHDGLPSQRSSSEAAIIEVKPKTLVLTKDSTTWVMSRVKVLNRGSAALQFSEISASCGCASATVMKNPVQPMDIGELLIRINTENLKDSVNVIEYTVNCNASNSPYLFRVIVKNPSTATK